MNQRQWQIISRLNANVKLMVGNVTREKHKKLIKHCTWEEEYA